MKQRTGNEESFQILLSKWHCTENISLCGASTVQDPVLVVTIETITRSNEHININLVIFCSRQNRQISFWPVRSQNTRMQSFSKRIIIIIPIYIT